MSEYFNFSGRSSNGWKATGSGFGGGNAEGDSNGYFDLSVTTPEPGTLIIFGSGMVGLAGVLRRKMML